MITRKIMNEEKKFLWRQKIPTKFAGEFLKIRNYETLISDTQVHAVCDCQLIIQFMDKQLTRAYNSRKL